MQIEIYTFDKKINSTARPSGGTPIDAVLKEPTSIYNPVLTLSTNVRFNYLYIVDWNSYYWVNNITFLTNDIIEISCNIDVLATYKESILNTTCNILYAADSSKNIIDRRIPVMAGYNISENQKAINDITITGYDNLGAVVLGITGAGSFGAYLMQNSTQVSELIDGVDDWANSNISSILDASKQLFFGGSAAENVKSSIALPIVFSGSDVGTLENLTLGAYPCKTSGGAPIQGYRINKPIIKSNTEINIPWTYSDWRRNTPYSQILLYLPFIGLITLPTADIVNESAIIIGYSINVTSGDIAVEIKAKNSGRILSTSSGNIAVAITFGSAGINTSKLTTSVIGGLGAVAGGVATIATGGAALPAVLGISGGLAAAAGGTLSAIGQGQSGSGGLGGGASQGLDRIIHIYNISRELTESQANFKITMGAPYFGTGTLSQHSGFVMTEGFTVNGYQSEDIKNRINSMCDSGIYVE